MANEPQRPPSGPTEEERRRILETAVDTAIELTVWRNVRRYVILAALGVLVVTLAISLTVVVLLASDTRASDSRHQAETRTSDLRHAQAVCNALLAFDQTQVAAIERQRAQTAGLAAAGFTFGIPKAVFDRIVAQNNKAQDAEIAALADIARLDCRTLIRVPKRLPPAPKPKPSATPPTLTTPARTSPKPKG